MFTSATQLSNATKASIDSHLAALNEFAAKALTTVAEVAELNMPRHRWSMHRQQLNKYWLLKMHKKSCN